MNNLILNANQCTINKNTLPYTFCDLLQITLGWSLTFNKHVYNTDKLSNKLKFLVLKIL